MKTPSDHQRNRRGSSLIEVVIAVGVMAVAVPLVFGALAESGKSGMSAEAETRSAWIIPLCMEEIKASRESRSEYFPATTVNQIFPPSGEVWALGFSAEGKPIGKISKSAYDKGTKELSGKKIMYITTLSANPQKTPPTGLATMLSAQISLEYPAGAPAAKRQKLDFFTRIP